jgi:hypothetical protein
VTLQPDYDGAGNTRATAPLYVISGAGGHELKNEPMRCPGDLLPVPAGCTSRAEVYGRSAAATIVTVADDALRIRRVTTDGAATFIKTVTARSR